MSRVEEIIESKLLGKTYDKPPLSRIEKLLLDSFNFDNVVDSDQWAGINLLSSRIDELNTKISQIHSLDQSQEERLGGLESLVESNGTLDQNQQREIEEIKENALTMDNVVILYPEFTIDNDGDLNYVAVAERGEV